MMSSNEENEVALREGFSEEDGFCVGVNLKYNPKEEYKKPGYLQVPKAEAVTQHRGYEGSFISGKIGGVREVATNGTIDLSAEAVGPHVYVGSGVKEDGFFGGGKGSVGKTEYHAGILGLSFQGPSAEGTVEAGKNGLDIEAEANLGEGKIEVGRVKLSAVVGVKGTLRADSGGVGAIVPFVGGAVVTKESIEVAVGPIDFKIDW